LTGRPRPAPLPSEDNMTANPKYVPLSGSTRSQRPGARDIAAVRPDERLEVTVRVRRRKALPSPLQQAAKPAQRKYLTHGELKARSGPAPRARARVEASASEIGLTVTATSVARRSVMLSGTAGDFNKAFKTDLRLYEHNSGTFRSRVGPLHVPDNLAPVIEGVFGLTDRAVAKPHLSRPREFKAHAAQPSGTFTPPQLAKVYNFPTGVDGTGQCIGIIELGGGFQPGDLKSYFQSLGLAAPQVIPVSVDHGQNSPDGNPEGPDGEVMLDIEVAGAVASGAKIAVYFTPPPASGKHFLDAITKAVHDTVNKPSVISISWGGPEQLDEEGQTFMRQFDQVLQSAAALG